ncbi:oxidoreductase [Labilibaculum sp.]|uniref:oxidoreductase n=1 Tax=Labilibaculum sp. TaxID=2060723 RepID=UPI002AA84E36|nr:oxidoreductase [Labilibaculum sp.]MBN2596259.1 SDR family NAD(P)-dependent oxidoreductase [Marinifilaceae bacterium]
MKEKIVLITGASSGIGKASALLFIDKGYSVYATAPSTIAMTDLEEKGAKILQLDVTNSENCRQVVNRIYKESKHIDILVNNAGFGLYGAIEDVPLADAREQFEVNLFGLAQLTQMILPKMRANREGRIINISSILGRMTLPMGGWYHASKYALEGISDCLRQEVKSFGIKVILINPGAIESDWANIALSKASKNSKNTNYRAMTIQLENLLLKSKKIQVKAEKVAEVIVKASLSKNPKIRYIVPTHAKLICFLRQLISEKSFDYFKEKLFNFHS